MGTCSHGLCDRQDFLVGGMLIFLSKLNYLNKLLVRYFSIEADFGLMRFTLRLG